MSLDSDYTRFVDVYPGGYYKDDEHTYGAVQVAKKGNYAIKGYTMVAGDSSHQSNATGTLVVN